MNIGKPVKRLRLEHAFNVRDMGGYEVEEGKVTAFGRLLRSDGLQALTDREWSRLLEYGVGTVLDLRSKAEIEIGSDEVPKEVRWLHCPMQREQIEEKDIVGSAIRAFTDSLAKGYLNMVQDNGDLLAAALKELISGLERGAVLFHCSAGKDRTGVLASAVYYLVGVEREDIIADYEVTYTYNRRGISRMLERVDEETREKMAPFLKSDGAAMERLLLLYEEIDLPVYLSGYGVTEAELQQLKKYFLV